MRTTKVGRLHCKSAQRLHKGDCTMNDEGALRGMQLPGLALRLLCLTTQNEMKSQCAYCGLQKVWCTHVTRESNCYTVSCRREHMWASAAAVVAWRGTTESCSLRKGHKKKVRYCSLKWHLSAIAIPVEGAACISYRCDVQIKNMTSMTESTPQPTSVVALNIWEHPPPYN
eukprot:1148543-Pelagomonas_calceolata.AAC.7